jgi:hypothetical protein
MQRRKKINTRIGGKKSYLARGWRWLAAFLAVLWRRLVAASWLTDGGPSSSGGALFFVFSRDSPPGLFSSNFQLFLPLPMFRSSFFLPFPLFSRSFFFLFSIFLFSLLSVSLFFGSLSFLFLCFFRFFPFLFLLPYCCCVGCYL